MKSDDILPFLNCMPLSSQRSCKYLIRVDPSPPKAYLFSVYFSFSAISQQAKKWLLKDFRVVDSYVVWSDYPTFGAKVVIFVLPFKD